MSEPESSATLHINDTFHFKCGPGISCFTQCCRDVTIFLTPYDVLRMKNRLGIRSGDFMERYTTQLSAARKVLPLVVLKMNEEEDKRCPFVTDEGCTIYEDRPWSCRMYPLDQRGPVTFRFIADPALCKGLQDPHQYKVSDYIVDQGILVYKEMEELFDEITGHEGMDTLDIDNERVERMLFTALYDLDGFRDFVFESRFLDMFQVDDRTVEAIRRDDVELMKFAFQWIRYGLFGDPFFELNPDVAPSAPPGSRDPS